MESPLLYDLPKVAGRKSVAGSQVGAPSSYQPMLGGDQLHKATTSLRHLHISERII